MYKLFYSEPSINSIQHLLNCVALCLVESRVLVAAVLTWCPKSDLESTATSTATTKMTNSQQRRNNSWKGKPQTQRSVLECWKE